MKRKSLLLLSLSTLLLTGCTAAKAPAEVPAAQESAPSTAEDALENTANTSDSEEENAVTETHLELAAMEDYSPFYTLRFQKIDGETGEPLLFEGSDEPEDQVAAVPTQVETDPSDNAWGMVCYFDGEENLRDTIAMYFWNRGGGDTVSITIDGLTYQVALPKTQPEEITLNQELKAAGESFTAATASLYPKALLLELSDISEELQLNGTIFLLKDSEGKEYSPTEVANDPDAQKMELLYVLEDGIPDGALSLSIGERADGASERTYQDYVLHLE